MFISDDDPVVKFTLPFDKVLWFFEFLALFNWYCTFVEAGLIVWRFDVLVWLEFLVRLAGVCIDKTVLWLSKRTFDYWSLLLGEPNYDYFF
jgi:hypothetical protein